MEEKDYTLVFCRRQQSPDHPKEILLGMKKRGFGAGKWNGFGGKLEPGETIAQAALRELNEESGVTAQNLTSAGYLVFNMIDFNLVMRVHVFTTWEFSGEPTETDEMRPKWYLESDIPFDVMWDDDKYWFPKLLSNTKFLGRFTYEDEVITDSTIADS